MKEQLEQLKLQALAALQEADTPTALEELRVRYLGKKGEVTAVLKQMGSLSAEERPIMGQLANNVRSEIEAKLEKIYNEQGDVIDKAARMIADHIKTGKVIVLSHCCD